MEIDTTVKVTLDEIKTLISEKYNLQHYFNLCILDFDGTELTNVEEQEQEIKPDKDGWYYVPENWNECRCPTEHPEGTIMEFVFRDGEPETGATDEWHVCWVQDGVSGDIIKYRVVQGPES